MDERLNSIFREYYADQSFVDRFITEPAKGVDVIIPVMHTNELWEANLLSFYREIPIHRLLIGDGGCIDDSINIVKRFPRVQIYDHRNYQSLGYSVRKLIEEVEADWFVYVHSDAYLPPGWFDAMKKHQNEYDWFGSAMRRTIMVEYDIGYDLGYGERPWAGSQMGRKKAFESGLSRLDDDYGYRQEDYIFSDIVKQAGFKEGKVPETFHYHQTMYRPTTWSRKVKAIQVDVEMSRDEEVRTFMMQGKGIVKYLQPSDDWLIVSAQDSFDRLIELKMLTWRECKKWIMASNPVWWPHVRRGIIKRRSMRYLKSMLLKIYDYRWYGNK